MLLASGGSNLFLSQSKSPEQSVPKATDTGRDESG